MSPYFLKRLSSWLVLSTSLAIAVSAAEAANYFFDQDATPAGNNASTGAGLGYTGAGATWDLGTPNWWDLSTDVVWPNSLADTAVFTGTGGTVTLGNPINAGALLFNTTGYNIAGSGLNTLTTGGTITVTNVATRAEISAQLSGSNGLNKQGNGTLVLSNAANNYTGDTVINGGSIVVTDPAALGSGTSAVVINGNQTRGVNTTGIPYYGGGQLVLGGSWTTGMNFTRDLMISGGGPSGDGVALISVGNNTISGNVSTLGAQSVRLASTFGTTDLSGIVTVGNSTTQLTGNGNWNISGSLVAAGGQGPSAATGVTLLEKAGAGTLTFSNNASNNFAGQIMISAGNVRVTSGAQLGTSLNGLRLNAGTLEIRADAANFNFAAAPSTGNINVIQNSGVFVDHGIGGANTVGGSSLTAPNSITLGQVFQNNNTTLTVSGRNGIGTIITGGSGVASYTVSTAAYTFQNGNNATLNNSSNGLLQIGTLATPGNVVNISDTTVRNYNLGGNGDKLITGSLIFAGAAHNLIQAGTGNITILGNASNYSGATTASTGSLSIAQFGTGAGTGSIGSGAINLGATTTTGIINYLGLGGGAAYGGTGAGESVARAIVLGSASQDLFANQTGTGASALTITTLTMTGAGAGTTYFGGSSNLNNTISAPIVNGTVAYNFGKNGTGTWVLSGNNTYTGVTAVYGGTLVMTNAATTALAGALVFNSDVTHAAAQTGAALGGDTGAQTAGGTFRYAPGAGNLTFTGGLFASGGLGNVVNNGTTLTFNGTTALTRVAGAQVNFSGTGATKFTNAQAGTNGILGGFATINGTDFVASVGAGGTLTAVSTTPLIASVGSSSANYLSNGSLVTSGPMAANSLKISGGGTVTLDSALAITATSATSVGGILFDNSGGAGGITGGSITTSGPNQELIFYTGGTPTGNEFTVTSVLANGSGGVVKGGTGTLVLSGNNTFTGNLTINEGTVKASGATANLLGTATAAGNITTIRQTGALDLNGAGLAALPYTGAPASLATVNIGLLNGGGSTSPSTAASTTVNGAVTNSTSLVVTSLTGIAIGQTIVGPTGSGINGSAVVTGIDTGTNTLTLSNPLTLANSQALNFVSTVTTGATITNSSGTASAISIGNSTSNVSGIYTGVIKDGAGQVSVIRNGTSTGTQLLTGLNTYTGATILSGTGAVLAVTNLANGGLASGIGASSSAASNLVFNGGTLQYVGASTTYMQLTGTPSVSIDRQFTMAANGTIASDGSFGNNFTTGSTVAPNQAALVFNSTAAISFAGTGARTLTLQGGSTGDNELAAQLIDNGASAFALTKAGGGLWIVSNTSNSYTGLTTISAGALRVTNNAGSLPTNSALALNGGVLETSGTFTRSLVATPTVNGGGVNFGASGGGFAASGSKLVVALGGLGSPTALTWGSGGFQGPLILSSSTAIADVEFRNAINLGAATRTVSVTDNSTTATDYATISGVLSGGAGGNLAIQGGGTLQLTGQNSYVGTTAVGTSAGSATLVVSSLGNSVTNPGGTSNVGTTSNLATSAVLLGNAANAGTLNYIGAGETSDRNIQLFGAGGGATIDAGGYGALKLTNVTVVGSGAKTLTLRGVSSDDNTISSNLSNVGGNLSITKTDGGTWILSGNNSGATGNFTISQGLVGIGSDTALGAGTVALGNGTLFAVGGDRTLANNFTVGNGVAAFTGANSILLNGSFTNAGGNETLTNTLAAGKTLTFAGPVNLSETANNRNLTITGNGTTIFSGTITSTQGGNITLNAPGGTLQLNGASPNSFTNGVTLTNGSLVVGKVGAFGAVATTTSAGASAGSLTINLSSIGGLVTGALGQTVIGAGIPVGTTITAISTNTITLSNPITANIASGQAISFGGIFNFNGGTLSSTIPLTGANAIFNGVNMNITQGAGATVAGTNSIEFSGNVGNVAASNMLTNNLSGGAALIISGNLMLNAQTDGTARNFTLYGTGNTSVTGGIQPIRSVSNNLVINNSGITTLATTVTNGVSGNLVINAGTTLVNGTGGNSTALRFTGVQVNSGGTLQLDNTAGNSDYRLGIGQTGFGFGAAQNLTLSGGTLNFVANAAGSNEFEQALTLSNGGSILNFTNSSGINSSLTFGGVAFTQSAGSTAVVTTNGGTLGTTNRILFTLPVNPSGLTTVPANGAVLARILVGNNFATYDTVTGIVGFANYNTSNDLDAARSTDTLRLTASPTFTGATTGMWAGNSGAQAYGLSKTVNALSLNGNNITVGSSAIKQLTLTSGGVLVNGTGNVLAAKLLNQGGVEAIFHILAGSDLTVNSGIVGSGGVTKADDGTLVLAGQLFYTGATTVNGGTLQLGAGVTMPYSVSNANAVPTFSALNVNSGTFDLNGNSVHVGSITTNGITSGLVGLPNGAGVIDNTSATAVNLLSLSGNNTFTGVIKNSGGGALTFYRSGNSTTTFTSAQLYTGATYVLGGTLQLVHSGSLASSRIDINAGTLNMDNTGLSDSSSRVSASATINLNAGSLTLSGQPFATSTQAVGTVNALLGSNTLNSNPGTQGQSILKVNNLVRSAGTTVNFAGTNLGQPGLGSGQILLNQINGQAVTDGQFLGTWAIVNGSDYGTYRTGSNGSISAGVGALGTAGFGNYATQNYYTANTPATAGLFTSGAIVNLNATVASSLLLGTGGSPALYKAAALRFAGSLTNDLNFANATDVLQLEQGGLLRSNVANNTTIGATAGSGILTAGLTGSIGATELIVYNNQGTTLINSLIKDTKDTLVGGAGLVSLVKGGGGILSLGGINTYSGSTIVDQGTLTLLTGSSILNSKKIVISNAALTETTAQQIAADADVTLNAFATLTLVGTNTIKSLTYNNVGATANPVVTGGTLIISGGTITVVNDVSAVIPYLASILDLNGSNLTVTTSGLAPESYLLQGVIQSGGTNGTAGGALIKAGNGSLFINGTNTFTGGLQLNQGTLLVDNNAAAGTGTLTIGDGTSIQSVSGVRTMSNAYTVSGNFTNSGLIGNNGLTLSGAGTFTNTGSAHTITVVSPAQTLTLAGTVSSIANGLVKNGQGVLAFTGAGISFTQGLTINNGQLTIDSTATNFAAPVTANAGSTVNFNAAGVASLGLNAALSITGAGEVTKTGGSALTIAGNLNHTGATSILAGSLILAPTTAGVAPSFTGSSALNLQANGSTFVLDNTNATAAFSTGNGSTTVNFLARDTIVQSNRKADFDSSLSLGLVKRSATATGIFNFSNNVSPLPTVALTGVFNSVAGTNKIFVGGPTGVINQGVYIQSGTHSDFAYRDTTGFVRTVAYGVDASSSLSDGTTTLDTAGALKITGTVNGQGDLGSASALSTILLSGPNANLAINNGATVFANGILRAASGANPYAVQIQGTPYFSNFVSVISGGTIDSGTQELTIRTDSSAGDTAANQYLTIGSVLKGTGGITKTGGGTLALTGSGSNTNSGVTTLLAGTTILQKTGGAKAIAGDVVIGDGTATTTVLQFGNGYSQGFDNQIAPTSVITFNTSGGSAFLRLSGTNQTVAGIQTLAGTPIIENTETALTPASPAYYASTLTINNATDNNLGAGSVVRDGLNTVTQQYASLALVKGGAGKLTTGILNNTGGITVNAGSLVLGASTTAPASGQSGGTGLLSVATGAIVDLSSFTARFDGLSGSGIIQNTSSLTTPNLAAPNLILGNLDSTDMRTGAALTTAQSTWSGNIQDGAGAVGIFVQKVGHGTQTINTVQGFTKGLSIFGGTLALDFNANSVASNIIAPNFGTPATTTSIVTTAATANATTVTVASTAGLSIGQFVGGTGTSGVLIVAIPSATTFLTSANVTLTTGATLTFGGLDTTAVTTNSATITVPSTIGLAIGQGVSGAGIPAGAYITAITGATTFTINSNAASVALNAGLSFTAAPMTLNGALSILGRASGTTSQTVSGGLNIGPGSSSVFVNANGGAGTTLALGPIGRPVNLAQLPGVTVAATGYSTNFGTVDFSGTGTTTTTSVNNATGILGAYATFGGNDWAAVTGGTVGAYTGYTPSGGSLNASSNVDVLISNALTLATVTTYNTLHFADATVGANTVTINSPGSLVLAGSGILQSSTAGGPAVITGTGTLSAGNTPGASDLIVNNQSVTQPVTINTVITNNPTAVTPLAGATLIAGAVQTLANTTGLYPGMAIASSGGIPAGTYIKSVDSATQITLSAAATAGSGTLTYTNANGLTKTGPGSLVLGSTANTFTGQVAVLDGTLSVGAFATAGTAQPLGMGSFATVLGGGNNRTGILQYTGASTTTALPFYLGDGGFGEFQVSNASAQTLLISSALIGGGGLNISSAGGANNVVALNNASNAYLGQTRVKAGGTLRLLVGTGATLGPLGAQGTAANGTVVESGATLDVGNALTQVLGSVVTSSQSITLPSVAGLYVGMTVTGTGITTAAPTITLINTGTNTITVSTAQTIASGVTLTFGTGVTIGQEVLTISGAGVDGKGALLNSSNVSVSGAVKNLILADDATIGTLLGGQIGVTNGFIQGNGHTLSYAAVGSSYIWFINSVFDNLPQITLTSASANIVVQNMSFAASGTTLTTTGAMDIQLRNATLGDLNLGNGATLNSSAATLDNYINGTVVLGGTTAVLLKTAGNDSLTINGNITGVAGANISTPMTKNGTGLMVFGGTANKFASSNLTLQAGVTKVMPLGGSNLVNPLLATNNLVFNTLAAPYYPANTNEFVLDNSKTAGSLSQSFTNLSTGTGGGASTIALNNATGNPLALLFTGTFSRAVNSELFLSSSSSPTNVSTIAGLTYQAPSATGNRIDIAAYGTGVNPGVFFNTPAGTEYVIRDTVTAPGTPYLRPVNYGTDANTNGVAAGASAATVGTGTGTSAWTKVSGSVTAQGAGTIGALTIGATGSLAISSGTLIVDTKGLLKNGGGSGTISGGTLQLGSSGTGEFLVRVDSATDTLNVSSLLKLPTITGNTIYKYGQGRLTLSGANTAANLTSAFDLREGYLRLANSTALGALTSSVSINNGAVLELDGTAGNLTIGTNPITINSLGWNQQVSGGLRNIAGANSWAGAITLGGTTVFTADANSSLTFSGAVGGAQDLYLTGAGNLSFTTTMGAGSGKTFYHIGNGTVTIKTTAAIGFNGNIVNRGGTLALDYGNLATPNNLLATSDTLITSGGTVQFIAKSNAASTQTLTALDIRGGVNRFVATPTGSGTMTVNFGNLTVSILDLGSADFSSTGLFTINKANGQNGIIGNNFTVGDNWAVSSGASAGTISALGTYTEYAGTGVAATDYKISTGAATASSGTQVLNSLKLDATAAARVLNIAASSTVDVNGILFAGAFDSTINGAGATSVLGRTTSANYLLNNGTGNVSLNNLALAANTTNGLVFAGIGSGGFNLGTGTTITTTTGGVYFEGGLPGAARQITNVGTITTGGAFIIGLGGGDNVVFTQNAGGVINVTGTFNVAAQTTVNSGGASTGTYTQNGGTFSSTGAVTFGGGAGTNATNNAIGNATLNVNGGTFYVGSFTQLGTNGNFTGTQTGGTIFLNRPNNVALYFGRDGSQGGSANFTQSGGVFTVNGTTAIGDVNGGQGTFNVSGGATNFLQGLILGVQDYSQGTFNQTGGVVSVGTGSNINDSSLLKLNNTIDLMLAYNQTNSNGLPGVTKGTYNLNGGTLQANGIYTGQGNGYLGGANAAASTYTSTDGTLTTTSGGSANFNWGAGTLRPFDNELTIGAGVNVTINAAGATVNSNDKDSIARQVTFNTGIASGGGTFGLTTIGSGTVLLNAVSSYTGDTIITSGTVKVGIDNALGNGTGYGNVVLNSGASAAGTLDLNGKNLAINGLNGNSTNAVLGKVVNNGAGTKTLSVGAGDTTSTFDGVIRNNTNGKTGVVAVTKVGSGTLNLGGTNTYTGITNVNAGELKVGGSLAGDVNVAPGATLSSGNNVSAQIGALNASSSAAASFVSPGTTGGPGLTTIGLLTANGDVTLGTGATAETAHLQIEIGSATPLAGTNYDQLNVIGSGRSVSLANTTLDGSLVNGAGGIVDGTTYFILTLADATSTRTGTFANASGPTSYSFGLDVISFGGQTFAISYEANFVSNGNVLNSITGGNDIALLAIPEPSSMLTLLGSIGIALGLQRFRRRRG